MFDTTARVTFAPTVNVIHRADIDFFWVVYHVDINFFWQKPAQEYRGPVEYAEERRKEWREFWSHLPQETPIPHDPLWRERFFSIQSAVEGNHPVWKASHVLVKWVGPIALGASLIGL